MPYTMEDFEREVAQDVLDKLTPQKRLEGLSPEQRLEGLSPEQLVEMERCLKKLRTGQAKTSPEPPKPQS